MAEFTVTFEKNRVIPPEYKDWSVTQQHKCGLDSTRRDIVFNQPGGDFVIGKDWDSPSGASPKTIVLESYTDKFYEVVVATGAKTFLYDGIDPFMDESTGQELTYSYEVAFADLGNIVMKMKMEIDLPCGDHRAGLAIIRVRQLTYHIIDTNDITGPTRVAEFRDVNG